MSEFDSGRPFWGRQSVPALPPCSDINLLGYRERIVDLDTKVAQTCRGCRGGFGPMNLPLFQGCRWFVAMMDSVVMCMIVSLDFP